MIAKAFLFDLDNTLYNWVDYFGPSIRALVHVLSRETNVSEDDLYENLKRIYLQYSSIEYPYTIQKLDICQDLDKKEIDNLVVLGQKVFSQTAIKNLKPYDGVIETLSWAKNSKIILVCVTSAPLYLAEWRLKQLRIIGYFYGIAGRIAPWDKERKKNKYIREYWCFSESELNPKRKGYIKIITDLGIPSDNVFIIGDNYAKDVIPAFEIGANGVLANYGKQCKEKNLETIKRLTTLKDNKTVIEQRVDFQANTIVIEKISELMKIVEPPQRMLPGII